MYFFIVLSLLANKSFGTDWSTSVLQDLLKGCENKTHAVWVTQYRKLEGEFLKRPTKDDSPIAELLFPHLVFKFLPRGGALLACHDVMTEFLNAKGSEIKNAKINLALCYQDEATEESESARLAFLKCLDLLK